MSPMAPQNARDRLLPRAQAWTPPPLSARDKVVVTGAVMFVTVELCERESSSPRPAPAV